MPEATLQENIQDTIKEAAYTSIGVSAIAFEKINAANADLLEQINKRFDEARKDVEAQVKQSRKSFDKEIKVAKKTAASTTKDLRARFDPVAEEFEARLPIPVARFAENRRKQAWEFIGAAAPAPVAEKAPAKKAPAKKATKASAKKTSAKKTASKTTKK
ncbi:MAG: hypothetical protein HKN26_11290 [Acidimicrobiales bacterium]|nr:hypothetical protein [Acidimicrobiales bacterium]